MEKPRRVDALASQASIGCRNKKPSAETVDQNAHLDAAPVRPREGVDELLADVVGAEDIGGETHLRARLVNGRKHFRIGRIATKEMSRNVARDGWASRHRA